MLSQIDDGLIVSCQPVDDGPMDNVAAVAAACALPIVGIIKRDLIDSPIRITPFLEDVVALADAGATIIPVYATQRQRPVSIAALLAAIHAPGRLAMAVLSNLGEATAALEMGFDLLGTTISGYWAAPFPKSQILPWFRLAASLAPR